MTDGHADHPAADVLIVDDTPHNLRLLSQMLAEHGYKVRAVTSGARALAAARAAVPDLILLDIRMPELDGIQVCQQLKADRRTRDVPVLFISALDQIRDKVRAFGAGGVDYITKPFQLEEVLARVGTHLALRESQQRLRDANARFERELALAGKIQAGILPRLYPAVEGWQFSAALQPARETSGDFYDMGVLPDGSVWLLIADVTDKGAGAALYMALCCALIRTCVALHPAEPQRVMEAVNQRLRQDIECEEFVTAVYGVLDPGTGAWQYCNAGHNPPYLVQSAGAVQVLSRTGMPLGIAADATWERGMVHVEPGGVLTLYTDGVIEAQDDWGAFFGLERLLECLQRPGRCSAHDTSELILTKVREFVGSARQSDDMALVVVARD